MINYSCITVNSICLIILSVCIPTNEIHQPIKSKGSNLKEENVTLSKKPLQNQVSNVLDEMEVIENWFNLRKYRNDSQATDEKFKLNKPESETLTKIFKKSNGIAFEEKAREDGYDKTRPEENPYSVFIAMVTKCKNDYPTICTGSLLTENWVLTAAHCLISDTVEIDYIIVFAGISSFHDLKNPQFDKEPHKQLATEYIPHPKYNPKNVENDVGVVKVPAFKLTNTIKTIKLAKTPWPYSGYHECKVTGFGRVLKSEAGHSDDYVRKTHILDVKKPCLCESTLHLLFGEIPTRELICSRPKEDYGICSGDSGSALVCDGEIRGVTSFILKYKNVTTCDFDKNVTGQCGDLNTVSVFIDVCYDVRWINENVKLYRDDEISDKCIDVGSAANGVIARSFNVILVLLSNIFWFKL